jgi:hypothetical protein
MLQTFTPYSTTLPYVAGSSPAWVSNELDRQRINAYNLYEQIFWTVDEALLGNWRGEASKPIVLPTGRKLVEATNRFLARHPNISVNGGTPADQELVGGALNSLFARERWRSMYNSNKRNMLIRGDAMWHVTADADKPPGRRVSIHTIDPASYYPITDLDDPDKLLGCHIVDVMADPLDASKQFVRRVTYRKDPDVLPATVTAEVAFFALDGWDDRMAVPKLKPQSRPGSQPPTPLPPQITALPVYHARNVFDDADPFGSSELRGYERALTILSQTYSDEDLAVALEGLGIFVTNSGAPVDDDGNELPWVITPARVLELAGSDPDVYFKRVEGIKDLKVMQDHMNWLLRELQESSGAADVTLGRIDNKAQMSGIALALEFMPMLSKNEDKAEELLAICDHQIYDLVHGWLAAYEGLNPGDVRVGISANTGMPLDRDAVIKEVTTLLAAGLIDIPMAQQELADKLGYSFPDDIVQRLLDERAAFANAGDPFGQRLVQELTSDEQPTSAIPAGAGANGQGNAGAPAAGGA